MRTITLLRDADADQNGGGIPDDQQQGNDTPATPARIGEATTDDIAAWKKKYPLGVYEIEVPMDNGTAVAYFKKPDRHDLNASIAKRNPQAYYDQFEELARITFIGGEKEVFNDEQAYISIMTYMSQLEIGKSIKIKNL